MNTAILHIDTGDTAWILICTALVLLMTLGLAFFQAGLARREDTSAILIAGFMTMVLVSLQWVLIGYTLAFGPDRHGSLGNFAWVGLRDVLLSPDADYSSTIPQLAVAMYQGAMAVFASVLILGAYAERIKFSAFILFTFLWTTLVFDPIAHWIWGMGGFLRLGGALDFGGGAVVHVNAAVAMLVASLVLGNRRRYLQTASGPPPLPLMALGTGLLWVGSIGLIAGNAMGANGLAANALVCTQVSAAAAGFVWLFLDRVAKEGVTLTGVFIGVISGLVAITPAAGFVSVMGAMIIGAGSAFLSYVFVTVVKKVLEYDDSFDVFGVYAVSAVWGVIATGLWSTRSINLLGADGFFYGNPGQLALQIKTVLTTSIYSFVMTYLIFKLLDLVIGVRVKEMVLTPPVVHSHTEQGDRPVAPTTTETTETTETTSTETRDGE